MNSSINTKQRQALGAVASGHTLKEAAAIAGYSCLESVFAITKSNAGKAYLKEIAEHVDAETVFSIRERLEYLKGIARTHQISQPAIALAAVKSANRIIAQRG